MSRRRIALSVLATLTLAALVGGYLWLNPPLRSGQVGFRAPALDEVSGMVASRRQPGVFWVHNDSGDAPRIFAVRATGELLGEWAVDGAEHVDWEAIAVDDDGHLWIGDFGNNANRRKDLRVYRLPEPDARVGGGRVAVDRIVPFRYAEQSEFPPPKRTRNFDAEALFFAPHPVSGDGTLYLLTKHRGEDLATVLYRFDDLSGAREITLTPVDQLVIGGDPGNYGGMVTGADASPDGQRLAVLSYHALFLFERPAPGDDRYLTGLKARVDLDQRVFRQCEAVAWDGPDLIIANEQRRIFRVPQAWGAPPTRLP